MTAAKRPSAAERSEANDGRKAAQRRRYFFRILSASPIVLPSSSLYALTIWYPM